MGCVFEKWVEKLNVMQSVSGEQRARQMKKQEEGVLFFPKNKII
jgi:hypothetical protein